MFGAGLGRTSAVAIAHSGKVETSTKFDFDAGTDCCAGAGAERAGEHSQPCPLCRLDCSPLLQANCNAVPVQQQLDLT